MTGVMCHRKYGAPNRLQVPVNHWSPGPLGGGGELPNNWLSRLASLQQMPPAGLLWRRVCWRNELGIFMARPSSQSSCM